MPNHSISVQDANSLITNFLNVQAQILNPKVYENLPAAVKAYFKEGKLSFVFDKQQLDAYFQEGANALRIYYAAHADGTPTLVVTASYMNPKDEGRIENRIAPPGPGQYPPPHLQYSKPFHLPGDNRP